MVPRSVPLVLALCIAGGARSATPPTFAHDIAPIIYAKCSSCHHPDTAAPFSLLSYQDVKMHAAEIAAATTAHSMPPWLPEHGYGDFANDRSLTPEQIENIAEWVRAGAPEGPETEVPTAPHYTPGWQLGKPDLVLEAPSAISVPATGPDIFWNVVFTPHVTTRHWVRAIEIRPGVPHVIHHANVIIDRFDSGRRQEIAPGKGFPGMDLTIGGNPFDPVGNFLFWKPGSAPHVEAPGFAWRLDPGNDLVLNIHIRTSGHARQVRPSLGLYFTNQPRTKFPILVQLDDDQDLNIPAGDADFVIHDEFKLPLDAEILGVYPHAHYLGHVLEGWATLPNGAKKWLLRIPAWDPAWQAVYYYRKPVFLPKGSVIHMRYHYDNSAANPHNPNHPPKRVVGGNQSTDEMGHLWLEVLPVGPGDRRREVQEAMLRHRVKQNPRDADAHMNLGAILLSRLDPQDAVEQLAAAERLKPNRPEIHNMLGLGLETLHRDAEAILEFQLALRIRPDFAAARFNLATEEARTGKIDAAIGNLRQILAANPNDPYAKQRLAQLLAARSKKNP